MTERAEISASEKKGLRHIFNKKAIINMLGIFMVAYTMLLIARICMSSFGNVSMPNEYREAANIQLTKAFIDGENPYRLSAYDGELPGMIYVYGPLYSVFTAVLGKLLPFVDLILLHYLVTFFSVLIAASLAAYMVFKRTNNIAAPAAVFLFIVNCSWRYGYINAVPDAFALMIYILIIFLISLEDPKKKTGIRLSIIRDIIYALLSISLFFVKQYFTLILAAIFVYRFINDRKEALRFFISSVAIAAVVFITVSITCPLYWTYSIYLAHGPFGITQEQYNKAYGGYMEVNTEAAKRAEEEKKAEQNSTGTEGLETEKKDESFTAESKNTDPEAGFGYEILQLKSLGGMFLFVFIGFFAGAICLIKKPDARSGFMGFLVILMLISSVALVYLGRNDGAWLSYYLQLLMPEVIIFAFIYISNIAENEKGLKYAAGFVLFVCMMFFTAFRTNGRLKIYDKTAEQIADWNRAYEITEEYASKGEVYYVPLLGFPTIYNGQYMYNNGHSMVITGWFKGEYFCMPWEQKVFPHGSVVMQRHFDYQEYIKEKAAKKDYSLVTIINGTDTDFGRLRVEDLENDGYEKIDSILLNAGRMSYEVQFWVPGS